ncbi:hypothetical protein ZWY2020_038578 [Hordeum vulgare]|nr:hypothetical protein ZWY2020_038578 [Hordeum vulgare]
MPPPPPSDHGMDALRFLASGKAPFDVRFNVDDEIFKAHRMVVGGGTVAAEAFRGVLHFIYTEELPVEATKGRGSYDLMVRLFEAADYYLIKDELKLMCACRLGEFIKDSTVKALMEIAEAYSCKLRSVQGPLAGVPELCGAQGTEAAA